MTLNFLQLFLELIPDDFQADISFVLAEIIKIVHEAAPDKWSVRVSRKNGIMVLIGMHEVTQILDWGVHFILDDKTVTSEIRADERFQFSGIYDDFGFQVNNGVYLSNPGTESCDLDFAHTKFLFLSQQISFLQVVSRAAKTRRHPSTKRNHSVGFIEFLSQLTHQKLPQPSYIDLSVEPVFLELSESALTEGEIQEYMVTRYERNPEARRLCLEFYGYRCRACDTNFEEKYGLMGRGIIHVHHLNPISENCGKYIINPINDLRPVCPNCHAVIHSASPPYSIAAIRKVLNLDDEALHR